MGQVKLYIVYKEQGPSSSIIHAWRGQLACEIIPLLSTILQKTLSTDDCERLLKELEEPYLARIDPYAESKPIHDPTWFYGRDELLKRLPAMLAQGQHVGIFGLRKVGKTSLINQLRQRFVTTPTVFIDCQAFSARAEISARPFFPALWLFPLVLLLSKPPPPPPPPPPHPPPSLGPPAALATRAAAAFLRKFSSSFKPSSAHTASKEFLPGYQLSMRKVSASSF